MQTNRTPPGRGSPPLRDGGPEIWGLAEEVDGRPTDATLETAAAAVRLADAVAGKAALVTLGETASAASRELARSTGMPVTGVSLPGVLACTWETRRWVLAELMRLLSVPEYLLMPHSAVGWELAPALAVDLDGSCLTGITGFRLGPSPRFSRPAFHGKLVEELEPEPGRPVVITWMPGTGPARTSQPTESGPVRLLEMHPPPSRISRAGSRQPPADSTRLRDADVVVAAGRGMGSPEALDMVRRLAGLFPRSAVGASRPLCDMGWLTLDHQVGMTGQCISPRLYIACGISGAVQHTVGIRRADLIVSVNTDPGAPINRTAHCCVVEDVHTFLPILIERIQAIQGREDVSA